jgi:crossover junction endodeoxyribonuclease RuvC
MRCLGIDPGTATLGWGIVEEDGEGGLRVIDYGALTTPKTMPFPQRLQTLYEGVTAIIARYQPDTAGVEELFFAKNVTTAISVSHARGVVLLALANAGLSVEEYRPMAVKQAVTGYGHADKAQIQEMVRMQLGLDRIPKPDDAADALAIAICHSVTAPALDRYRAE